MSDRIAHRGPDDSGVQFADDGRLALGFRRLAIIDLSPTGHQPMTNEEGRLWIVYNGEIYNYRQLRQELLSLGHRFQSTSDTEVILHGYEQWGERVLNRLRGMFAFALWDPTARQLFIARDRLGIKPLYYYWDGKRFAFASELKALVTLPNFDSEIDRSALWDYYTYFYIPDPKSIYKRARKLPPAHYIKFRIDQPVLNPQPYWDVQNWGTTTLSRAEAVEAVRAKLRETVEAHMIADVPVGIFLSGGLDSTAVTAMATASHPDPVKAFSIGFDVAEHSELEYAEIAARHFGVDHSTAVLDKNTGQRILNEIGSIFDEPFADSSSPATLWVSQLARRNVKVVLSGDGGDELFAGYHRYYAWQRFAWSDARSQLPEYWRRIIFDKLLLGIVANISAIPKVMGIVNKLDLDLVGKSGVERYGAMVSSIKSYQKQRLLPDLAREFADYDDYWAIRKNWHDGLDDISRLQYVDIKTYLPGDILTKVDRTSMATSLEVRVPLLDHEWVELIASFPTSWRMNKSILRDALRDMVPSAILNRPKKGFSSPMLSWYKNQTINGARLGGAQIWAWQTAGEWLRIVGKK